MSEEDDGMMLNFAAPSKGAAPARKQKTKVTGGRWKDRREAMRGRSHAAHPGASSSSDPGSGSNSVPVTNRRLLPRRRGDGDDDPDGENRPAKRHRVKETGGKEGGVDGTYVSSLFTANPEIQKRNYNQAVGELTPSNAPLMNKEDADFKDLGVNEPLCKELKEKLKYSKPTRIQRAVIPKLLRDNDDLFVQAQTGSGKTLSFTLPIIQRLMSASDGSLNRKSGLFAVILSPTRELAQQTYEFIANKLCSACHWIVPGIVIGGEKKKSEKARIRKGVNLLVATPGRLADHIENTGNLDLSKVRYLVLDEGDRLMDLGFEEAIATLLQKLEHDYNPRVSPNLQKCLPYKRVNVLCSATMSNKVKKLGEISLKDAQLVTSESVGKQDSDEMKAPEQLVEEVLVVPPKLRYVTLAGTLKNMTDSTTAVSAKTIVFFSCADSVDFHFLAMTRGGKRIKEEVAGMTAPQVNEGVVIYKLHGSLSQQARTATLQRFSKDQSEHAILFCTDVASRGLDLPDIKNVVEFDPPFTIEDHLHRVGRTARVGSSGLSVLFLLPGDEENYIKRIEPLHDEKNLRYMNFEDTLKKAFAKEGDDKGRREGSWDTYATTYQLSMERWLLEDPRAMEMATNAFISHTRAYATHLSSERDCFNIKRLHLGHLAKSFGLRETPKKLAAKGMSTNGKEKKPKEDAKTKMLRLAKKAARAQSDEFNMM